MIFNVLARNQDDHVKNISFLMDRSGRWSLAPAYDVTYAYNLDGFWTGTHQMSIHGKREHIGMQDLLASARTMGIKKSEAEHIIQDVRSSLLRWEEFAEKAYLRDQTVRQISEQFVRI